jgi:hypothetical protein
VIDKSSIPVECKLLGKITCVTVIINIIDVKSLRPCFEVYPKAIRFYEITDWWNFGEANFFVSFGNTQGVKDIKQIACEKVDPIGIGIAVMDFNSKNQDREPKTNGDINYLAFIKDDLIIITVKSNKYGWFEGYRARDNSRTASISHIDFINII